MKLLVVFCILLSGCSMVGPGEKALSTTFGSVGAEPLSSGLHLWIPFLHGITKFDLRVQKSIIETTAASKDLQEIHTNIAVNWRINPNTLVQFFKDVGYEDDAVQKVITPAVSEVLKYATAKKTAEEIIGRRSDLKADIDSVIGERLKRYGVLVDDVSIVNVGFSPDFTHAIEQKQIAEQQSKQAQYLAEKAVKDADAEVNKARGQRDAQQLLKATLTQEILQKMAIEKWNGEFPQVMGSQMLPFINMSLGHAK